MRMLFSFLEEPKLCNPEIVRAICRVFSSATKHTCHLLVTDMVLSVQRLKEQCLLCREHELRTVLDAKFKLADLRFVRDRQTGFFRGHCFLKFESNSDAREAYAQLQDTVTLFAIAFDLQLF